MFEPSSEPPVDLASPRLHRALAEGARALRTGLELWSPDRLLARSRRAPRSCRRCPAEAADQHQDCERRRRGQALVESARTAPARWSCSRGIALATYPVGHGPERGTLISRRRTGTGRRRPGGSSDRLLRLLAGHLAAEWTRDREVADLHTQLRAKQEELGAFYAMAGQLSGTQDLAPALHEVMETARTAEEADAVLLWTAGRRPREVLTRPDLGLADESARRLWAALGPVLRRRLQNSTAQTFQGLLGTAEGIPAEIPPFQILAVRLRLGEETGALALLRLDASRPFRAPDVVLLGSLSEQIRLAMSNADLYEDLQMFLMATVKSLVGAIEEKDPYTSGHSERVHLVSMLLGKELGISDHEMETLRWASILHDVGKIGMPESILLKPGKLTEEEFRLIREHPDRGYRLLRPIHQLAEAAVCIRAHHEQVNGTGYPHGLKGDSIPLLARIIAVADTFDALTSTRAYRTARTLDYALEEIRRVQGEQLDAHVVDCFFRLESFLREHQVMIAASRGEGEREAA